MAKILLVDDAKHLLQVVQLWLEAEKHIVEAVEDGQEDLDRLRFHDYDILVIDWGLPGVTGTEVCRALRQSGNSMPILMLTGKKAIDDKETGFAAGADDYLVKPFEMRELSIRIKALLRRTIQGGTHKSILSAGNLQLDPESHRVLKDGAEIHLQPKEFSLLEFFMRHPGQVFSLDAVLDRLWSADAEASVESVRKHITRLRQKIQDQGSSAILKTVHGLGYKLEP